MKHLNLLKSTLLLFALIVGSGSVWAADVTITFNSSSKVNSDGTINQSPYDDGNITLSAAQNGSGTFPAFSGSQLRLYGVSGGNGCSVTISSKKWISEVVFTFSAAGYAAANQTTSHGTYTYTSGTTGTWTGQSKQITLQNTNNGTTQVRITKIEITYGDGPTVVWPEFSQEDGLIAKGTAVTIYSETEGAEIYYTTDESTPTSSSTHYTTPLTIDSDVTIKAIAIKGGNSSEVSTAVYEVYTPVPGLAIDFEQAGTISYSDWEFNNIGIRSTITAHAGSNYGSNINANGNGVKTATITTREKVAHPGTFTCWISKESTNITTTTWKIQVSSDGSDWTDVASADGKAMSQAEWQEFTADLTEHSNVYVRLSFSSDGTAIRALDDISLTEAAVFAAGKTMISFSDANVALDLEHLPTGLKAYKVSSANASSVTLTEVTEAVAKNTALILTGTAGETYNIPVVGSGTDISGSNLLVASNGTDNVTSAYVLSDGKFHPVAAAGVVIPAGKAYLPAGSLSAHELDITFDNGDVTGIEAVETQKAFNGAFYNLAGQRVAQPAKGLYIVNGKKVVLK